MRKEMAMAILLLSLGPVAGLAAAAPQAQTDQKPSFTAVYDRYLGSLEKEVVSAAEAMPEDKFNFVPTQGEFKSVRTFAQQVKHIAGGNYMFAAAIMQEKPPVDLGGGENGPDNIASRADVLKFLNDSFAYLHKALSTIDANNILEQVQAPAAFGQRKITRLTLATLALSHPLDHYGQMVIYLRMNNIIPPASRKQ
jgi:hypothetical protein